MVPRRESVEDARIECSLSWAEDATEEEVASNEDESQGEGIEIDSVVGSYVSSDNQEKRRRHLCLGALCCIVLLGIILAPSIAVPSSKKSVAASNGALSQDEFNALWAKACYQPDFCTDEVLGRSADGYTCGARMNWLVTVLEYSRWDACHQISTDEFPNICGPCNPSGETAVEFEYLAELYCYQPSTCTDAVLGNQAGEFPCGDRIQWLMNVQGESLGEACFKVAVTEFPVQCGGCDPTGGTGVYIPPDDGTGQGGNGGGDPASGSGGGSPTENGPPPTGSPITGTPPPTGTPTGTPPTGTPPTGPPPTGTPPTGLPPSNGGGNSLVEQAFSTLDPVNDLNMFGINRPDSSSPSGRLQTDDSTYPTNAWYQNMLHLRPNESPNNNHRAYPIPYVVDVNGKIPGLRVHTFRNIATATAVTLTVDEPYALTLGATEDFNGRSIATGGPKGYTVRKANDLGFTLEWDYTDMRSSIVRGMPYATMTYPSLFEPASSGQRILPTVVSDFPLQGSLVVDGSSQIDCSAGTLFTAQSDVKMTFQNGLEWMVFVSQSVSFQCSTTAGTSLALQVAGVQNSGVSFTMRLAMVVPEVNGNEVVRPANTQFAQGYINLLRQHSQTYPGEDTSVSFEVDNIAMQASLKFHWDATRMDGSSASNSDMLMYALPHHQEKLAILDGYCTASVLGGVCLVEGSSWTILEELPDVSFRAPRRPPARHLPALAASVKTDLDFRIPDNFQIGAGDTYFGAKSMAKLARILVIAEEVQEICASPDNEYLSACQNSDLPAGAQMNAAVSHLRQVLDVWFSDTAEAPFIYDAAWGGVVSCGCYYDNGHCINSFPNCPAFTDQGLNFGNAFYNDHHFHYGYYIYTAAVLAHFDPQWGRDNFETVLVLIRDIANPSSDDTSFPLFRHKDWYFGSSWASGITQPPFPNGMNQESSSEAIASYEGVSLFGQVMRAAFESVGESGKAEVSDEVDRVGLLLTATELRSTKRYWHVYETEDTKQVYPSQYGHAVVGILWTTFIQFGTWFGNNPYLIYGIQLLPLTPISEARDDNRWAREVFGPLSTSCDTRCVAEGWSVQVLAMLATIGHIDFAVNQALAMPSFVFGSPGGSGHSKSNTVWYLSTRPPVDEPYPFDENASYPWESALVQMNCGRPTSCTEAVLNTKAGDYTCGERIRWLINSAGLPEFNACFQISVDEFSGECGACDPRGRRLGE